MSMQEPAPPSVKPDFRFKKNETALLAVIGLYAVACYFISFYYGKMSNFKPMLYAEPVWLCTLAFLAGYAIYRVLRVCWIMLFIRPDRLLVYLRDDLRAGPLNGERYVRALPAFISMFVLFSVYTSMKTIIPAIQPFRWDPFWADADRALHFGVDPWRLLQPVLGYPSVTKAVNAVYNLWLPVKYFVVYWMFFSLKDMRRRMQFFWACALCWIVNGTILAVLFSSAGPCFYLPLTGIDRFGDMMAYLNSIDPAGKILALRTQGLLWDGYIHGTTAYGMGISAMPSLHVSSSLVLLLNAWRCGWFWRGASILFYLSILAGSVHLGWHYAVDGYIATAITLALWSAAGKIVKRLDRGN